MALREPLKGLVNGPGSRPITECLLSSLCDSVWPTANGGRVGVEGAGLVGLGTTEPDWPLFIGVFGGVSKVGTAGVEVVACICGLSVGDLSSGRSLSEAA